MDKKVPLLNTLAIMSVFMIAGSAGVVGATIQPTIGAFPDVPTSTIRLTTTITSLTGMIVTFIAGFLAGKKISFRAVCIFGACCMLIGGIMRKRAARKDGSLPGRTFYASGLQPEGPLAKAHKGKPNPSSLPSSLTSSTRRLPG